MASVVKVRTATTADIPGLIDFARAYYGPASHQANPKRLEWLMSHNPNSQGAARDILIAATEAGKVVGCHWKTRLEWDWEGTRTVIPSLHDLAILPEYRQGNGMGLVLAALAGEPKAGLLGLSAISDGIYERMRCPRVPMQRLQKILSFTWTGLGVLGFRRAMPAAEAWEFVLRGERFEVSAAPGDEMIRRALAIPSRGRCHLAWNERTFRWRFFHALGPRHYLLSSGWGRGVFSLGVRRGAWLSRIVDAAAEQTGQYSLLIEAMEAAMRRLGVAVTTIATTSTPAIAHVTATGWKPQSGVSARFFSRGSAAMDFAEIWGGSYDYGYDASGCVEGH